MVGAAGAAKKGDKAGGVSEVTVLPSGKQKETLVSAPSWVDVESRLGCRWRLRKSLGRRG